MKYQHHFTNTDLYFFYKYLPTEVNDAAVHHPWLTWIFCLVARKYRKNSSFVPSKCGCIETVPRWGVMANTARWTVTCLLGYTCCGVDVFTCKWTQNNTARFCLEQSGYVLRPMKRKAIKCWFILLFELFAFQFLRNEVDHHGRSSRSPVMLFDIQENNNVNSFAVSGCRIVHQLLWLLSIPFLNLQYSIHFNNSEGKINK